MASSDDGTIAWGEMLSNRRRVMIIAHIIEDAPEEPISVGDLATQVAKMESQGRETTNSDRRHSVYVTAVRNHLPKLDEVNVIDYDDERKEVYRGEHLRTGYAMAVIMPGSGLGPQTLNA